eukprot:m.59781 g.59781  ORF g.59781 m.59781 type:complete len:376 (-) comp13610_c0_seq1:187-1314(-)
MLSRVASTLRPAASAAVTAQRTVRRCYVEPAWRDTVRVGLPDAVGKTPLILLQSLSNLTGQKILAKAEWMNPGGSVKDRAALALIRDAEAKGALKPGGTVVEGTAGNTGIGLAHVCNALGYKCVIFMPNTQSQEKIDTLRLLGATVHAVPAVPFDNPDNYNHQAKRFADSLPGAFWTNQFDNTANRDAHYHTTGPEIWEQTRGNVDAFVCATGTGGTLAGTGRFLKEKSQGRVQVFLADPPGSVLHNYVTKGQLERTGTGSITEGIGQGRVTKNFEGTTLDGSFHIEDAASIKMVYHLLQHEGICVGASSALNMCAAVAVAKALPRKSDTTPNVVVSVLCDHGQRYQARLFNKAWLQSKGLYDILTPEERRFIVG